MKRLVYKNLQLCVTRDHPSPADMEDAAAQCALVFNLRDHPKFVTKPIATSFDVVLALHRTSVFAFAASLAVAFACTLAEWHRPPSPTARHEESLDEQHVRDLAIGLGLLIYEAFIRIRAAKRPERTSMEQTVALYAFVAGLEFARSRMVEASYPVRCLDALSAAAEEYVHIDQNIDIVFEEIVLV